RAGAGGLDGLFAALLTLIGRADARVHVLNVELAVAAAGRDERLAGDHAALFVVRADIRQRERDGAIFVVAIANERVHGNDRNPRVVGALRRFDHRLLVGCRDDQRVDFAGDERIHDRGLLHWTELGRTIHNQGRPHRVRLVLRAALHSDVEGV